MTSKSVLLVATTAYMIRQFNMNNIKLLQSLGYQVEVACNFVSGNPISDDLVTDFKKQLQKLGVVQHQIPVVKQPLNFRANFKSYFLLRKLMSDKKYIFVHCQTPVGAVIARLAAFQENIPSLYMAHGFHFFKGASFLTWLVYYPIEWLMSSITDVLILINAEDYLLARKKMKAKKNIYIPGVGIDVYGFQNSQQRKTISKEEFGIPSEAIIILSVGELNKNKNHAFILRLLPKLPGFHYFIAGEGVLKQHLIKITKKLDISDRVHFLGYVKDTNPFYHLADIYCHPSHREGLSVAIMEAMVSQLPVICSDIRGNKDLIDDQHGGVLLRADDETGYLTAMFDLAARPDKRRAYGAYNLKRIEAYDLEHVNQLMKDIYNSIEPEIKAL